MWIRLVKKERKSGIATTLQDFAKINPTNPDIYNMICLENLQYLKDF